MLALDKNNFLLWFYHTLDSARRSLDTLGKHYAMAIIEKHLNERGFTTGYGFAKRVFGRYDAQLQKDFGLLVFRGLVRGDGSRGEQPSSPMLTGFGAGRFEIVYQGRLEKTLGAHYLGLEKRMKEILLLSPKDILQLANT